MNRYNIGIDIGSTTLKAVLVDRESRSVVLNIYQRHQAKVRECLHGCLRAIREQFGEAELSVCLTGSVGMGIAERWSLPFVQEVVAATQYIRIYHPDVSTMIDIGGEDAKMVFFSEGHPSDLRMNGNCAGGTGAFIDQMAILLGVSPEDAPDQPEYVTMTFEAGVPKTLNGKAMKVSEIITELNALGGKHGIGIIDIVENRVVGMKSRGVYETPGGTILMEAHDQLEELILDRETMETKKKLGSQFAQVVYEGKWFTPLREAIQAFVESTQKYVTGEVKFKLYKGNIIKAGTTSPYSLYNESLASFTTGDMYDHHDADGFITLFGLPLKVRALMMQEVKNNNK
mgnify:CR=1 FL=1